jgi:hypothetical protein
MWSMPSPGNTDLPVSEDCIDVSARMTCKADESMKNEQGGIVFHALRDALSQELAKLCRTGLRPRTQANNRFIE